MAEFLITAPDGKKYKVTGATKEGALAALKAKLGQSSVQPTQPQATPAQPPAQPQQDSSMGTALSIADVQAQAAGAGGMASISRNLENSWLADVQRAGREYVANPIREKLGLDTIDTDAVNRAESERLQKASDTASASADQMIKDTNFKNLTLDDINSIPSFLEYVGQKGAQSLPYMASAMATGGTMTYPFSVGEISSSLKDIEGKTQEEKDNIAATGGAIMTALENLGIASLLPKGVSSSIIGGIASGAITEGFTEGAQELVVIGSEALAGKKFTQEELLTRLKEAAAAGAAVGGSFKGATQAGSKVSSLFQSDGTIADPDTVDGMSAEAAADVARMIRQEAADNGYNLKKVGASDESGSKKALEAVHEKISGRLTALAKDPSVRQLLSPKQAKSLEQLLDDYAAAQTAIRQGKNKVKSKVTQENFDAIKRLLGPTKEGAEILNLLRQSNVVTDLFNNGLKGGLSQFTDYLNPFETSGGAYDPSRTMNVLTGGTSALTLGPLATAGIVAGGRAVDAVTGRRSVIDRFVRKNEGKRGLGQAEGRSLIEERAQEALDAQLREQEDQNRAAALGALPQSDKDNSPVGSILLGTGLDRDGLKTAMTEIEAIYQDDAVALKALNEVFTDIRKNLDGGSNKIRNLNDVIPIINSHLNTTDTQVQRAARPDQMLAQRGDVNMPTIDQTPPSQPGVMSQAPTQPKFGPQATTQENYNRGIESNRNAAELLNLQAQGDANLNVGEKAQIGQALTMLQENLGSNPAAAAQGILEALQGKVSQEAIDTYVKPYVDRVMQQQASRQFMPNTEGPRGLAAAEAAGVAPTVDTQAPTQPSDVEAPRKQLALPLFETPLPIEGKPTVRKIGEAMNQDHMDKVGRQLFPENAPEDYTQVLGFAEEELVEQLKQPNSGVGWYSKDVDESMRLASQVYPSLKDNQEHRQLYLTFAGIFSNGSDPDNAFIMSSWAFDDFLRTGKIPVNRAEGFYEQGLEPPKTTFKETKTGKMVTKDAGWGIRNQANEQQLGMLRYLVEREGSLKGAMDFLLTPQKRSDINDVMLESGLYKDGRFKTQKEKSGPDEFGFLAFGKKLGRYSLGLHGVEIDAGDTTIDLWYTRTYRRWTGRLLETPIGKEGVAAQPANDTERDVIFKITGELANKYDLPVGDVQALLWFFEKRTWGAQGLNTKEGTNSSGARKLLRERGIDPDAANDGTGSNGANPQAGPAPEQPRLSATPTGVAGILAQRMGQESGSRAGSNPPPAKPSTQEVKLTSKPVKGAMSVGKPGTETENGIKDMKQLAYLAEAWDIALNIYDDHAQMLKDTGVDNGESTTTYGVYDPKTRTASILRAGAKPTDDGVFQTEFESFITTLHEVAHGIAESAPDGSRILNVDGNVKAGFNFINKTPELVKIGSLEEKIMDVLSMPDASRNAIYKELSALQDKGRRVSGEGEQLLVREYGRAMEILKERNDPALRRQWKGPIQGVYNYIRSTPEFAVDAMISYLHDPKKFKQQAPKTAKMMRDFFNKSGKLTLYAHPLPMAVAAILAMLMKRDEDEERRKQQANMMPPGALNQPMAPGMLSAQQA